VTAVLAVLAILAAPVGGVAGVGLAHALSKRAATLQRMQWAVDHAVGAGRARAAGITALLVLMESPMLSHEDLRLATALVAVLTEAADRTESDRG
jgi:hypothetical protein